MADEPLLPDFEPTLPALLTSVVDRFGDNELIVHDDRRFTYRDIDELAADYARGMLARGIGKGTRVGLLLPSGPEWIAACFAAARIGALVVAINTYYKPRELDWVLRHADIHTLVVTQHFVGRDYLGDLEAAIPTLAGHRDHHIAAPSHPHLRSVLVWGDSDRAWTEPGADALAALADERGVGCDVLTAAEASVVPSDPLIMIYSSGSTSEPKGSVHTHRGAVVHGLNLGSLRDLVADDRLYTPMPLFWVGGFAFALMCNLHQGATLLTQDRFEPGETLAFLERERATLAYGWPHVPKAMVEHPSYPDRNIALRGGSFAPMLPEHLRPHDPGLRTNSLGMTETFGPHTYGDPLVDLPERLRGSFGPPVRGVEHRIVDTTTGEPLPPGEHGELQVRGYSLMAGLYKHDRDEVFTTDGWYPTGDGGYFTDDGHLMFEGRLGDVIKSSGMLITPREIELVVEEMPEVKSAVVVPIPHPDRMQDAVAAIIVQAGATLDEDTVRSRLRADMASYKVPRRVAVYTSDDDVPWLDSGKIDRRALADRLAIEFAESG